MAFSNSPLVTYTKISPNKTSPRTAGIDRITIHCIVGQWTAKQGCDFFSSSSRKASCNYVVGKDGSVGLCVEEKDRSWCSSSAANDHRAVTIETASDTTHPYAVTDEALTMLKVLCEDICKRNGKRKLLWFGDKETALNYSPARDEMVMTVHRWFANKACPGEYLYNLHGEIADTVTARLQESTTNVSNEQAIWDYFYTHLGNEYGVAGLMGNLYAESGLYPDRVQGDIPYSSYSKEYTADVDSGAISESDFVNNGPGGGGYGLAQWTYPARKQGLYDMYKAGEYSSIGCIELALDYLLFELSTEFDNVLTVLENATSVRVASDAVLYDFERPANQSPENAEAREELSQYYYDMYSGSYEGGNGGGVPDSDTPGGKRSKNLSLLLISIASDRN